MTKVASLAGLLMMAGGLATLVLRGHVLSTLQTATADKSPGARGGVR
jgi:hypothetical protein